MQSLAPFLLFAVVASITPGPTNILVLSNSQRHGLAAAWPIVLGACAAVAALILLLGLGLGELLRRHPLLQQGLAWLGVGW
ncbi:TPA: LysE family transporter, partial [Pseudomonas aeruginosa]|nr:LysE family transporter [Pseudomonas aeruginosa]